MPALGLRGKSLLALLLACLIALIPAVLLGWQVLDGIRTHFGLAYARNTTLLKREQIFAPLSRELALARRLADSELSRHWLAAEADPQRRARFFREAEAYRRDFRDHSYFLASARSNQYYFNDAQAPYSENARYRLNPARKEDGWFYASLRQPGEFNINISHDRQLQLSKAWINIIVRDGGQPVALAGTGLDLSTFLHDFIVQREAGVTPMIVDRLGNIQAHPDRRRIVFNVQAGTDGRQQGNLLASLASPRDTVALRRALQQASEQPGSVPTVALQLDGRPQLLALSFIPELGWHVLTAIDPGAARVVDSAWLSPLLLTVLVVLVALLFGFAYAVDRLVLRPIAALHRSALALADGDYDLAAVPQQREDEIGQLGAAFAQMAGQVRHHTRELEDKVRQRTEALAQANAAMAATHAKLADSLDYASLIQRALLPERQLQQQLDGRHAVLWQPRDVVGGDCYVFRSEGAQCLLGVVDCAGHGVPGALMTMLAHAAISQAIGEVGLADPAAILSRCDAIVRSMLAGNPYTQQLATSMEMGLCHIDQSRRQLRYAGARIALHYSDGHRVASLPAERRAIGAKRPGQYHNQELALRADQTFYLCTDGLLDQVGGEHGHGFGHSRLQSLLLEQARLPLHEQVQAFADALRDYQGSLSQRDDITVLCFRFD